MGRAACGGRHMAKIMQLKAARLLALCTHSAAPLGWRTLCHVLHNQLHPLPARTIVPQAAALTVSSARSVSSNLDSSSSPSGCRLGSTSALEYLPGLGGEGRGAHGWLWLLAWIWAAAVIVAAVGGGSKGVEGCGFAASLAASQQR